MERFIFNDYLFADDTISVVASGGIREREPAGSCGEVSGCRAEEAAFD